MEAAIADAVHHEYKPESMAFVVEKIALLGLIENQQDATKPVDYSTKQRAHQSAARCSRLSDVSEAPLLSMTTALGSGEIPTGAPPVATRPVEQPAPEMIPRRLGQVCSGQRRLRPDATAGHRYACDWCVQTGLRRFQTGGHSFPTATARHHEHVHIGKRIPRCRRRLCRPEGGSQDEVLAELEAMAKACRRQQTH
jgi:hypothetical protein